MTLVSGGIDWESAQPYITLMNNEMKKPMRRIPDPGLNRETWQRGFSLIWIYESPLCFSDASFLLWKSKTRLGKRIFVTFKLILIYGNLLLIQSLGKFFLYLHFLFIYCLFQRNHLHDSTLSPVLKNSI